MNFFTNPRSGLLKALFVSILAAPVAVSCHPEFDPSGLQEQIDMLVDKLYELEQKMNSEIKALKDMMSGKVMITEVSTDVSTGVTTVVLSDGTELELLPEKDLESYVTYMTLGDGKEYWAYIGEDGAKHLFLDKNDKPVPVLADTPQIKVDGDATYIIIGGVSYPISGNSVFSNYELIVDELTGDVYAVTFTFGDDMTFTVTVDGAAGMYFVMAAGGFRTEVIDHYYVPAGVTERVQFEARGVVDFVIQKPDGWKVVEYEDVYMGARYFDITAPVAELVESGLAVAEGDLKVLAVLEGGKSTIARLDLSSEPFTVFNVSLGKVYTEMNNGLQKYVCGVCSAADFDETSIFETASGLLESYDYPQGYAVVEHDLRGEDPATLAGEDLVYGEKYVFWAIPAIYYFNDEAAGYYLKEGTFETVWFSHIDMQLAVIEEGYRDILVSLNLQGVENYYMELLSKEDFMIEDVLFGLNGSGIYTPSTWEYGTEGYSGSVFALSGVEAEPATDYVAWLTIAEDGKEYVEGDILVVEMSTLSLAAGGTVNVTASEPVVSTLDAIVTLTAEGADNIYYAYLSETDSKKYTDDAARSAYLFEYGTVAEETTVVARLSDNTSIKRKPQTKYFLYAVATVGGKYGEVEVVECVTTVITYNDLAVELELLANDPGDVAVAISADGSDDFVYWIGKVSDNTWKSSNYLGGSAETAQAFMAVNAEHGRLTSVMEKYPIVDGMIYMQDLDLQEDYVIVAMAQSTDGNYSKATELKFTTRAVAIGTVVTSDDAKWEAAKPKVEFILDSFEPSSGLMSGQYAANITIPTGYTGYVLLGTDSYINEGNSEAEISTEDFILKVIDYADQKRDADRLVDEDAWITQGYPYGYEFMHFPHGSPEYGNRPGSAVIWASEEFHNSRCGCLENAITSRIMNGVEVAVQQIVLINDGNPVKFLQANAIGNTNEVIDRIFIVCQDLDGNCYETYEFDVPFEYFRVDAGSDE